MKIVYPTWLTKCDDADIEEAYEEATVDRRWEWQLEFELDVEPARG